MLFLSFVTEYFQPGILFEYLHIASGIGYITTVYLVVFILYPVTEKYMEYSFMSNFYTEAINAILKLLHIAIAVTVLSGASLAGIKNRDIFSSYGIWFSIKMSLFIMSFLLAWPFLKVPDSADNGIPFFKRFNADGKEITPSNRGRIIRIFLLVIFTQAIIFISVLMNSFLVQI